MSMTPHHATRDEFVGDPRQHLRIRLTNIAIDTLDRKSVV